MEIEVWYNPEKNWFELYFNGKILPIGGVKLSDNFENNSLGISATVTIPNTKLVNPKPQTNE